LIKMFTIEISITIPIDRTCDQDLARQRHMIDAITLTMNTNSLV
jgi:hypothetical protein